MTIPEGIPSIPPIAHILQLKKQCWPNHVMSVLSGLASLQTDTKQVKGSIAVSSEHLH